MYVTLKLLEFDNIVFLFKKNNRLKSILIQCLKVNLKTGIIMVQKNKIRIYIP